ncbi:L,D-transpeptidase [Streptomyces sp. NBC_01275]|uniref:L,D-transpeptidase n=1 Tax=Streptomyces sp. NBC_01275 TaxID=2903807 RepID=UPI00225378FE|nr:L,D-transpeptidase [Streptomyces sp. NBC_01275]MCX4762914.1 L,D-transpeptidase [Streptomyces sp. NBC_01275]
MPVPARRLPSWVWVSGLTTGAVAAVVVLTVKAEQGPHPTAATRPTASASANADAKPSASPKASPAPSKTGVPDASGTGRRVVYDLSDHRVWLVDADDTARRTFVVWPGTIGPVPGTYTVSVRKDATTGSDGVEIEHIIYFSVVSGVNIAFSNAVDGSSPPPAASGAQTGGIRMAKADGAALWAFGDTGTKVRVVE